MEDLFQLAKNQLVRANKDRRHPFTRMVLSTCDGLIPKSRWVVNRGYTDPNILYFYSDSRAGKMTEIKENDRIAILFFHDRKNLQIRVNGKAMIIESGEDYNFHRSRAMNDRQNYSSLLAPGTPAEVIQYSDEEKYFNFSLIKVEIQSMDILMLGQPHQRVLVKFDEGKETIQKLVP